MQTPLQLTFRNLDNSPNVEAKVRERVEELEHFYNRITSCRVVIEEPNRHRRRGRLYHIRVDLKVPGEEIVVKRDPSEHHAHQDIYVAVHDCFDAVRRRLEEYVRRQRGEIKAHAFPEHGWIADLFAEKDYGFIEDGDGADVYFHRNAVAEKGFDKLAVGDEVRFAVQLGEGDKGPQAFAVAPIRKHHLPPQGP